MSPSIVVFGVFLATAMGTLLVWAMTPDFRAKVASPRQAAEAIAIGFVMGLLASGAVMWISRNLESLGLPLIVTLPMGVLAWVVFCISMKRHNARQNEGK